jgi:2'-aminobiphenyl-2,3-diol 1,2-dioxygenase, large subunit
MSRVVGAFTTSHILMAPNGVEERANRVFEGMAQVGKKVQAAKPDLLVIISGDHMYNINMAMQVPICVGVADRWTPFGDMDIEKVPFPGHRAFAEHFVTHAASKGYDIAKSEELQPDHGIALPRTFADPQRKIPVVPVLININMTPLPSPKRIYQLGKVLKEAIEAFPGDLRIAVLGTGGLSHWLFMPRMGEIAVDFDKMCLSEIAAGHAEKLANLPAQEIVDKSGNGGIELVIWLMAAATVEGKKGEQVYYEPMPEWLTGMGGLAIPA